MNPNLTAAVMIQPSCSPPMVYASSTLSYIGPQEYTLVRISEVTKVINTTHLNGEDKYPSWFPSIKSETPLKYDAEFCSIICQWISAGNNYSALEKIRFGENWGSNSTILDFDLVLNSTREKECDQKCPENRITYSATTDSNLINITNYYGPEFFVNGSRNGVTNIAISMGSDKMTVQEIKQKKTPLELFAEVGGQLGLLAGASVLTFFEFGEFLFLLFILKVKRVQIQR